MLRALREASASGKEKRWSSSGLTRRGCAAALGNGSVALAGGTELVPLLRDGLVEAEQLVDVRGVVPRGVDGTTIGAGTTLAELEVDPQIPDALREACRLAASPQLRAMGTIGGNLLQATRCWYWRLKLPVPPARRRPLPRARGRAPRARDLRATSCCASAHPSDVAAALLALGARVRTTGASSPLAELYRLPTEDDRDVAALEPASCSSSSTSPRRRRAPT